MRTLLIDGDLYAYIESIVVEEVVQWENKPGLFTLHSNVEPAEANFNSLVIRLKRELEADRVIIAMSDPNQRNWRVDLWPRYKAHRRKIGMRKPICYAALLQRMAERWKTVHFPRLEGDDVLGWLAGNPAIEGEKVIVSVDKDMHTIPDVHIYNTGSGKMTHPHSVETADYHHLLQTLVGDISDGYPGCPGMGKVSAPKILANTKDMWKGVLAAYLKKDVSLEDTLMQARLARILRFEDYNIKEGTINLWTPPSLVHLAATA